MLSVFQRKQEALDAQSRGVAAQLAAGADDPVAGDDDGERVPAVGIAENEIHPPGDGVAGLHAAD